MVAVGGAGFLRDGFVGIGRITPGVIGMVSRGAPIYIGRDGVIRTRWYNSLLYKIEFGDRKWTK